MKCTARYVSGYRRGQACPYDASEIIGAPEPFFVCGYHARAYVPDGVAADPETVEVLAAALRDELEWLRVDEPDDEGAEGWNAALEEVQKRLPAALLRELTGGTE